jgi:hypothetical protein
MPVIPALGRLRQKDREFKASLNYLVSSRSTCVTYPVSRNTPKIFPKKRVFVFSQMYQEYCTVLGFITVIGNTT